MQPHLRESIPNAWDWVEHRAGQCDHCAHEEEPRVVAAVSVEQEACSVECENAQKIECAGFDVFLFYI